MHQIQCSLGNSLPISLILLSNGTLAFVKTNQFKTIIDQPEDKENIAAIFDEAGFKLGDEDFEYNIAYAYKEIEVMLKWLMQQNLQQPQGFLF